MQAVRRCRAVRLSLLLATFAVGLAVGFGIESSPGAEKGKGPPSRYTLPVEMRPQETELWCWAATGQMTMEFLGKNVTQSEQANRLFQRSDCDDHPVPKPCVRGGMVVLGPYGFHADVSTKPLSEDEVIRQIATLKKPIPFGYKWPGGGGHIGLLVGYVRTTDGKLLVEILDPFPPSKGERSLIPYKRWASGTTEFAFDHVLFNVSKKP
jgi:hypothetical protein